MIRVFLISFVVMACVGAVGVFVVYTQASARFETPLMQEDLIYTIPKGATLKSVASDLTAQGYMSHARWFDFGYHVKGMKAPIHAGEYQITAGASMADILTLFQTGANYQRMITIPEGLTRYEIVKLIEAEPALTGEVGETPPEGHILPETYAFQKGEARADVLARMAQSLRDTLRIEWERRALDLPLKNKEEALVLASIIEKETGVKQERQKVAGVFVNRLRIGMRLQTDPTVIYALTQGRPQSAGKGPIGRRLLRKDLQIDSPYNTYLYAGLPPTPIANASRASIHAALNPAEHDYLYFVADGTGGHAFAQTLEGHNRNVAAWRKIRRVKTQAAKDTP